MNTAVANPPSLKPGIYPGVPFLTYKAWDAANQSMLKQFKKSPMHARQYIIDGEEDTESFLLGRAIHTAALEPDKFAEEYAIAPDIDGRTTVGKLAKKTFAIVNANKQILTAKEHQLALDLGQAVQHHPLAMRLLSGRGLNELSILWDEGGTLCKARIDRLTEHDGKPTVVDIKTTRDHPSHWHAAATIGKYGYHIQAASNLRGLNALATAGRRFVFIFIEKSPPHDVVVYELDGDAVEQGEREYKKLLARYAECVRTGNWPGYSNALEVCSIPAWAFDQHEGNDDE